MRQLLPSMLKQQQPFHFNQTSYSLLPHYLNVELYSVFKQLADRTSFSISLDFLLLLIIPIMLFPWQFQLFSPSIVSQVRASQHLLLDNWVFIRFSSQTPDVIYIYIFFLQFSWEKLAKEQRRTFFRIL